MKINKIEYAELKRRGLSEKALEFYNGADPLSVFEIRTENDLPCNDDATTGIETVISYRVNFCGTVWDESDIAGLNTSFENMTATAGKRYRVMDEFIDTWFSRESTDDIATAQREGLTQGEIEELARGWGMTLEEALGQVIEI